MAQDGRKVKVATLEAKPATASSWGTPLSPTARKLLLLGSGELGKEVAIEAQRLGLEVVACDRYAHAPAMQVAHRSQVLDMTDPAQLRQVIEQEDPDWVVPEIEAIATPELEVPHPRLVERRGQHRENLALLSSHHAGEVLQQARAICNRKLILQQISCERSGASLG